MGARLFVAVDPPADVRAELAAWGRRAAGEGARPVEAAAIHVTLCFLGVQPVDLIDEIAGVVGARATPVGRLGVGGPVWLPRRRPRALAIDLHDETGGLAELAADVARGLGEAIGWEPEARRFRPHVTVARMRPGAAMSGGLAATPSLVFEPEALTLYRSRLGPGAAEYEPLARIGLLSWGGSGG